MNYMTITEAAEKWGITARRVQKLCEENRIDGLLRFGRSYMIPRDAKKPVDARIKSGKYIKKADKEEGVKKRVCSLWTGILHLR